jgi:chorismate mutase / prephenate dehydratase
VATLDELRGEIDQIDVTLHDLLIRRVEIGREVARAKAGASVGGPNLRPGREAQIMRRLAGRNRDPLSIASVARIWREILSANLNQQVSITAAVFSPDMSINDLAREYCGTASSVATVDSAKAVVDAVANGSAQIGVLPGIESAMDWRWWPLLLANTAVQPRIIARLPFFKNPNSAADAVIIGPQEPEPSGDDITLFAVKDGSDVAGNGRVIDYWRRDETWHLVEVDGFVDHPGGPENQDHRYRLGAYATQATA